jgi:hypothetical protein
MADAEKKTGGDGRDEKMTGQEGVGELTLKENDAVARSA